MKRWAFIVPAVLALGAACKSSSSSGPSSPYDFSAMHQYLFGGQWQTDGVVVMYKGKLVYEEYANGYGPTMRHITYSASKSMGSALVGVAVGKGLMKLSDSVCTYITKPPGADPTLCDTTVEDVVQMLSGLSWIETYGTGADPATSNVLQMLYGDTTDMGAYAASQPRAAKAGTVWNYSSGDANILALALKSALKGQDEGVWATDNLFQPAGLSSALFEKDRSGTLVFSSSCFMTPRDMASFGQLYLDDGVYQGSRILPEGWVASSIATVSETTQPLPAMDPDAGAGNTGGSYGYSFWLNTPSPTAPKDAWLYPQAPADMYSAEGHYGQKIMVIPSQQLVIARVGDDRVSYFDPGPMVADAIAALNVGDP